MSLSQFYLIAKIAVNYNIARQGKFYSDVEQRSDFDGD
jgi:hypothetical protein